MIRKYGSWENDHYLCEAFRMCMILSVKKQINLENILQIIWTIIVIVRRVFEGTSKTFSTKKEKN